ncbi:MAG: hypothetical protein DRP47_01015 [Candidatus Zixiibacteriota bacterium]|nr:MAG: hypothetical protein DRP47_01015 [candidate division Zixibacteria bacterium]
MFQFEAMKTEIKKLHLNIFLTTTQLKEMRFLVKTESNTAHEDIYIARAWSFLVERLQEETPLSVRD